VSSVLFKFTLRNNVESDKPHEKFTSNEVTSDFSQKVLAAFCSQFMTADQTPKIRHSRSSD